MKTHIQIPKSELNALCIVCGSPERAKWFSSLLANPQPVAQNREYDSYRGLYKGQNILVCSHGIGSAGAAICFRELADAGMRRVVRVGTAGGLTSDSKIGDIVVASGAIREDGATALMVPKEFPAIADRKLTARLARNIQSTSPIKEGIVLTSDLFYPELLESSFAFYQRAGAVAVEMECSTLFVISSLRGIEAASILVLDGNALSTDPGDYHPSPAALAASLEAAFRAAAEALVSEDDA